MRQRDAVEAVADADDGGGVVAQCEGKVGLDGAGAVDEQAERAVRVEVGQVAQWREVGKGSEGTRKIASPSMPSGSRLVARMRRRGQARSRVSASRAQASSRCSQLSSSRQRLPARAGSW